MDETTFEQNLGQAYALIENRDYQGAEKICQAFLDQETENSLQRAEMLNCLGSALVMLNRYPEAYDVYNECLDLYPDAADPYFTRGIVARVLFLTGQALQDFTRALSLESNAEMRKAIKSELDSTRKVVKQELRWHGPRFQIEQLIQLQTDFYDALTMLRQKKWTEAETLFRSVIRISDELPQPQINLGVCLLMQRQLDEAEHAFRRALEIQPGNELAKENLLRVETARQTGEISEMIEAASPYGSDHPVTEIKFR